VRAVVVVTSDKCYENDGTQERRFVETDALGGRDPYSSSKAAAEIATASWRASFFSAGVGLATARAGNVIGGGDWSDNRLIPDVIRALAQHQTLTLRYPAAIRPWQHVLEPLAGYLMLARALCNAPPQFSAAWNFGPHPGAQLAVKEVVHLIAQREPDLHFTVVSEALHEAPVLQLDSMKANRELGWHAKWSASEAVTATMDWYDAYKKGASVLDFSLVQIEQYAALAAREALS
jgi:CDP-glucose 4,6-dehydratase